MKNLNKLYVIVSRVILHLNTVIDFCEKIGKIIM
jgi:hypothetical protein